MAIDIVYKFRTSLEGHLLTKPFMALSHAGWVYEPFVMAYTNYSLTLKDFSFFCSSVGEDAGSREFRLFHVSSSDPITFSGLVAGSSVAVGFYFPFVPDAPVDVSESLFHVLTEGELSSFGGLILGRLYFVNNAWKFITDCVDFADKYFVDNHLTDYRVAPFPLRSGVEGLNLTTFVIKHYNDMLSSVPLLLQKYPDGDLSSVNLVCANGVDLSTIPSDSVGSHPRENWFYALGHKSFVLDDVNSFSAGSYQLPFSVLGHGVSLNEAVRNCIDSETGLYCSPMAVIKWSPYKSEITQYKDSFPASPRVNRTFKIDTNSAFVGDYMGTKMGLNGTVTLPVPVNVSSSGAGVTKGLNALSPVINKLIQSISTLSGDVSEHVVPFYLFEDSTVVHLGEYYDCGVYVFTNPAEGSTGLPPDWGTGEGNGFILEVFPFIPGVEVRQTICHRTSHQSFMRFSSFSHVPIVVDNEVVDNEVVDWSDWGSVSYFNGFRFYNWGKNLSEDYSWNLDRFTEAGIYVLYPAENATDLNHWPKYWSATRTPQGDHAAVLEVFPFGNGMVRQVMHAAESPAGSTNLGSNIIWVRTFGSGEWAFWSAVSSNVMTNVPSNFLQNVTSCPEVGQSLYYYLSSGSLNFGAAGHEYSGTVNGSPVRFVNFLPVVATWDEQVWKNVYVGDEYNYWAREGMDENGYKWKWVIQSKNVAQAVILTRLA